METIKWQHCSITVGILVESLRPVVDPSAAKDEWELVKELGVE